MDETPADDRSPTGERELIDAALRELNDMATVSTATSPPSPEPTLPPDSFSGYEIVRELHRGGQGVVYQAIQKSTKRKVAIKVMREGPFADSRARARFAREVEILGQLQHPNIVAIHDSGESAGHFYYVMDYIAGQPLDEYMASREASIEEILHLFVKICQAVNDAHLRGIIHRDLKPGNIRIDSHGEPHILDFGLAKTAVGEITDATQPQLVTVTGQFLGSLPWASPEQAQGRTEDIDIRSDVYSLGVILYEMLTGSFPYEVVGNVRDVLDNILKAEPTRPSTVRRQISNDLETIVLKSLSKAPERRYQIAGELARDIGHFLAYEPIEAKRDSAWYVLRKTMRRYRLPVAIAGLFVIVMTASAVSLSVMYARQSQLLDRSIEAERHAEVVARFLEEMLTAVDPQIAMGRDTTLLQEILDDASERLDREFGDQGLIEASLRDVIGYAHLRLLDFDMAEANLTKALELRRRILGADDPKTLDSMRELLLLYSESGRYEEAEALGLEALDGCMRVLGEDDRLTLSCMHNLGHLYLGQHRLSEAEKYLVPALEGHRRIFGRDDIDTLSSMSSVAALRLRQERYSEAEALSMEGIEIAQDALGPDHPEVLDFRNTLMNLYREQGRHEDALRIGQELLASCQRVFGPEKPNTAIVSLNLARLHMDAGQYVQAESLLADVAVWGREVMSERNFGSVLAHYGRVLTFLDRCAEAEGALLEARNSFENSLGPAHPATLSAEIWLAELYDAWHEAEPDKGYDAKAVQWRAKLEEANRMPGDDREVLESDDS